MVVGAFLLGGSVSVSRSISNYFVQEGQVLIGGDIVLSGATPIDIQGEPFKGFDKEKIIIAEEYSVQAVFKNKENTSTVAASIRAVGENFPLYGDIVTEPGNFFLEENGIYAESSFLDSLEVSVGDDIFLGDGTFTVLGVLEKEPDGASLGISFSPKVIMRGKDFSSSNIDLTQSRSTYKVLIKENSQGYFSNADKQNIESFSKENKLRYDDSMDGPNNFVRGLSSVKSFLGIVLAISLFLVVVNIITNLTYILSKFKKTIAIMKTFGAKNAQVQAIYSLILGLVGLSAGALGSFLGALASNAALPLIASYTGSQVVGVEILPTIIFGGIMGLLVILSAALPFFRSLNKVTAKELLSNITYGTQSRKYISFLLYLPVPIVISLLLYVLSSDIKLVAYSMIALITSFALFMTISYFVIKILYKVRNIFPFVGRSVISSLSWRGYEAVIVIASIMTAFSGVFLISTIEKNILVNINQNVSEKAPDLYIVDITTSQIEGVKKIVGEDFVSYPVVRGRLLEVNNKDVTVSSDPGITREFNMTYRSDLLNSEQIVSGIWHGKNTKRSVSIDESFAKDLGGVDVGDTLKIFVQGLEIEASITSVRTADRTSGTPFFFLVFSPDVISRFPASYFGSIDSSPEEIIKIKSELGLKYPNIIPIETSLILSTVTKLIESALLSLKIIGIPSILLGIILVLIMTGQSMYERKGDVLVFRAFGLRSKAILSLFILEIVSLVLIASSIAYGLSHGIAYGLNNFLFSFNDFVFDTTPVLIITTVILLVSIFACIVSKRLIKSPLKNLLSEK
jgi:putative ABC transport system permease protein